MYDLSNNEELSRFFNLSPELEESQRFKLHNREEVDTFELLLNRHVESETCIPFHSLNLVLAFDYCMGLGEFGGVLFPALLDLKITIAFLFIDAIKYAPDYNALNRKDGSNIMEDEALFNKKMIMLHHNIDLAVRYRAFFDKLMGIVIMLLKPLQYGYFIDKDRKKSTKAKFKEITKGYIEDEFVSALIEQVTYLDDKYRTPEVHKNGSMRTWVLTSQDLFLDKQLNLMNYFNWVLSYADRVDSVIADNKEKGDKTHGK